MGSRRACGWALATALLVAGPARAADTPLPAEKAEARRLRLVEAYRNAARIHACLRLERTIAGKSEPSADVEYFREGDLSGVRVLSVRSPNNVPRHSATGLTDGGFTVTDGRETRVIANGEPAGRTPGAVMLAAAAGPLERALAAIATSARIAIPARGAIRPALRFAVQAKEETDQFGIRAGLHASPDLVPSWLDPDTFRGATVTEGGDSIEVVVGTTRTRIHVLDGMLLGWQGSHPSGAAIARARAIAPEISPERWKQLIRAALARPASQFESPAPDLDTFAVRTYLDDAAARLRHASPDFFADEVRVVTAADLLSAAVLESPAGSAALTLPDVSRLVGPSIDALAVAARERVDIRAIFDARLRALLAERAKRADAGGTPNAPR